MHFSKKAKKINFGRPPLLIFEKMGGESLPPPIISGLGIFYPCYAIDKMKKYYGNGGGTQIVNFTTPPKSIAQVIKDVKKYYNTLPLIVCQII